MKQSQYDLFYASICALDTIDVLRTRQKVLGTLSEHEMDEFFESLTIIQNSILLYYEGKSNEN